jgi:hypothetical protein
MVVDYVLFAARTLSTIALRTGHEEAAKQYAQALEVAYRQIRSLSPSVSDRISDLHGHLTLLLLQTARTKLGIHKPHARRAVSAWRQSSRRT